MPSLRTRYGATYLGAVAGTYDSVIHAKPVHYLDADGVWQNIDTTLVPGGDGSFHNAANDLGVKVNPVAAAGGELVHMDLGDGLSLGYGLTGSAPLATAAPVGASITLPGVLTATSLRITSQAEGVKEDLVLTGALAPRSFVYPLYLHGLTASLDADGSVIYRDLNGVEQAVTPHGWMTDSKIDPRSGDPAYSNGVSYQLISGGPSGAELKMTLDNTWLSDPARQWPVTVDPTTSTYHADSDDTYVQYPYTNDYSTDTILKNGTFDGGTDKARSFIHFSGLNALDGKVINSATFKAFENWSFSCTAEPVNLYRVTQSWSGSGLHSYPGWSLGALIDQVTAAHGYTSCPTGAYVSFDATTAMTDWADNAWANDGVALVSPSETNDYEWKKWDSVQGTNDPEMVVNWQNPDSAPSQVSGRSVGGNTCGTCTDPITADTTPTLTGTATDPDAGDTILYYFEVYPGWLTSVDGSGNASVSGVTASASGHSTSYVASGTANAWAVTPALADGKYSYRVRAYDGQLYGVWSHGWVNFTIDSTGPSTTVTSSTHPSQSTWYSSNAPALSWSASSESGIKGYSYVLDQVSSTVPDTTSEGTATSTTYSGLADGIWYFHVRAQNNANIWGGTSTYTLHIDATSPSAPLTVTSSSHVVGVPSTNRNVAVSWSAGTDATSGVAGYSVAFNNSPAAVADGSVEVSAPTTTYTSAALSDGTWYFHVRTVDNAGNASSDVAYGPFVIDGTGPSAPLITSTDHDQNTWSTNTTAHFAWTQTDASAVTGYSVTFDQIANSDPPTTVNDTTPTWQQNNIGDGTWYLHVRARDAAGNWGATGSYRVLVDSTAPAPPAVTSSTHPDQQSTYDNANPAFCWTASDSASGVTGYSFTFDQSASTVPDTTVDSTDTCTSYSNVGNGVYYFHIRALNGAGLWSASTTFQIANWILADAQPGAGTSDTPTSGAVPDPLPVDPTAVVPAPATGLGPIFPLVDHVGHLFPTGGLLGSDSFFGGQVLPSTNEASDTLHAFGSVAPPGVPTPNIGATTTAVLSQLGQLPSLDPYFSLIKSLTYQVDTTPYDANGQPGQTSTFEVPVCVPTEFGSNGGLTALPTAYDMRVNFCPDASSFDPSDPSNTQMRQERATYQLDALKSGVRVQVQITFLVNGEQIRLRTTAHTVDHPVDAGTGAPIDSNYACSNASTAPSTPPLPGVGVSGDTQDGYCLELKAQPHADGSQTVELTSAANQKLDDEQLFLDTAAGSSFTPKDHLTVSPVPVSSHHHYTLTALTSSTNDKLHIQLNDTVSNPGEQLQLEQYDSTSGNVAVLLRLSNVPVSFSTDVGATFDNAGRITDANVSGTQPAAPSESLLIQQNDSNGNPLNQLRLNSFATSYNYDIQPVRDGNNNDIGAATSEHFDSDVPAGGQLTLTQFANNAATATLDEYGFAPDSSFRVQATGDPSSPTGAIVDTTNSSNVADQLIQIVRAPSGGTAQRLVLAGTSAPSGLISSAVNGLNLRWDDPPRNTHTALSETLQPNNGQPGANTPGTVTISGTTSPLANPTSRIAATQQNGSTVQGMVLDAPSTNYSLRVDITGSLSNLTHARIERDNNMSRPEQGLQLYQRDGSGLHVQMRFLGASGSTAGFVSGSGDQIDGTAASMADNFSLDVQQTTSNGRPTDATLTGSNDSMAANADIVINDKSVGFTAHLHSLEPDWKYNVHAGNFDSNGIPTTATVSSVSQTADNPGGVIDLTYKQMRYVAASINKTYSDTISITGAVTNPTRATVTRSGGNANQLLQLAVGSAPQMVFTIANGSAAPVVSEVGTYADAVWQEAPTGFTLDLGRQTNSSSSGSASIDLSLGTDSPGSDLVVRQRCAAARSGCSSGYQELHAHGLSTDWHASASYSGSVTDPTDVTVTGTANVRHNADAFELLNYSGSTLSERLSVHGASATPLGGTPTKAGAEWTDIPSQFTLTYHRSPDGQQPVRQTVTGSSGGANPSADFLASQVTSGGVTQQLDMHGVAKTWSLTVNRTGSGSDPTAFHLDTTSSTRASTDYLQGLNLDATGHLLQRLTLEGSSVSLAPNGTPAVADFNYYDYPASLSLDYHRTKAADGSDAHFDFETSSYDASGAPVKPDDTANILARLYNSGAPSEVVTLTHLPQTITKLSYDLPSMGSPASASVNCLGNIDYASSDPGLTLDIVQNRPTACLSGDLHARIIGMPSMGFASTVVRPDGSASFATRTYSDGVYEEVPTVSVDMPVPSMAATFVNRAKNLDQKFCPSIGLGAGCMYVKIKTTNLSFDQLRLHLDAQRLTQVTVATNMGGQDWRQNSDGNDAPIKQALWDNIPLFAVHNQSAGNVDVHLSGRVATSGTMDQHTDCCINGVSTAHFDTSLSKNAGDPLALRFYGWTTKVGPSCTNPNGGGSQPILECNSNNQELDYTFGQMFHTHIPFNYDDEPFDPSYTAYPYNGSSGGYFNSTPGTINYYVPDLYDAFLSQSPGHGLWWVHSAAGVWQSDWFWEMLLREYDPDPLGMLNG